MLTRHPTQRGDGIGLLRPAAIWLAAVCVLTACASSPTPAPRAAVVSHADRDPRCATCGVITAIEEDTAKGEATGLGAVTGAVLGAVVGREAVNSSRGTRNTAAVVGAVGGGLAGHEIEKRARGTEVYVISVRMDSDLRTERIQVPDLGGLLVGDRVHLSGGTISRRY